MGLKLLACPAFQKRVIWIVWNSVIILYPRVWMLEMFKVWNVEILISFDMLEMLSLSSQTVGFPRFQKKSWFQQFSHFKHCNLFNVYIVHHSAQDLHLVPSPPLSPPFPIAPARLSSNNEWYFSLVYIHMHIHTNVYTCQPGSLIRALFRRVSIFGYLSQGGPRANLRTWLPVLIWFR